MASPSNTTAGIGSGGRPHFFKIILDDAVRDGKLFIPTKFVKKYGGDLQDSAVLRDPSGTEWTVELTESDGDVWLQKGFREFAEFYSLSHGYLVVFELVDRRTSCFNVVVFDPTATEIEYPPPKPPSWNPVPTWSPVYEGAVTSDSDESETDGDDDDDDLSVEILDVFPFFSGKPKGNVGDEDLVSNCTSSGVKGGIGRTTTTTTTMGLDAGDHQCKKRKTSSLSELVASTPEKLVGDENIGGRDNGVKKKRRTRGLSSNEKAKAIDRAKAAFTSQKPHFMVAIYPSYVYPANNVAIPVNFAREYFKARTGEAILSREYNGGRRWKVKYMVVGDNKKSTAFIHCGWKDFAGANQLRVGDVCAFELVKGTPDAVYTFRVSIIRKDQKGN